MIELKALLVLNGDIKNVKLISSLAKEADLIVCADGGANYCLKASLFPDLIIGDLDSISQDVIEEVYKEGIRVKKYPTKKDKTDAELSIDYLIDKGFRDINIVGSTGSRIDHTLANILLLTKLSNNGIEGRIIDDNNIIFLVDDELVLTKDENRFLSIVPISNEGVNISLKGFEYDLQKALIKFSSTIGISNKIIANKGYIKVHKGQCLAIVSKD